MNISLKVTIVVSCISIMKYRVRIIAPFLLFFVVLVTMVSCNTRQNVISDEKKATSSVIYASRFKLEMQDAYTRLDIIDPWQGSGGVRQVYYLVKEGSIKPDNMPEASVLITVPVKSIICMSATHVAMIASLGMEKTIRGVSGIKLIYNPKVRYLASIGAIEEVGYEESLNREAVLQMNPGLLMAYGIGGESAGYLAKLSELGIRVLLNAEYLELDPLGKAEWIKVFGALYGLEERADSLFNAAVSEYNAVKQIVAEKITTRPKVLLGLPWKDSWYISPGNSYISKLIADAGGEYLWHNSNSDVSMPLNLENVYVRAITADFWINPGSAQSLNDIALADHRLASLPVYKKGNVFNNINLMTGTGANDYWERGCTNPGLILKDLAAILHADLFPTDTLTFYQKLR
jgi:iron complex transport system substrate-binding protein